MRIWIDLANSPQVLFFRPIINELKRRRHDLLITSRDFAQTVPLADQAGFHHTVIGKHGGRNLAGISVQNIFRAWKLHRFLRRKYIQCAVGHNVYSQAIAAAVLRIPLVTLMDYEHQPANHICFRLANKVIVPEVFPEKALQEYGAYTKKVSRYTGVKEEMYLSDFSPNPDFLASLDIPTTKIICVMRPPGLWGLYQRNDNPLFDRVFEHIVSNQHVWIVFLPRMEFQAEAMREQGYDNVWVPDHALDGPNLIFHADFVISGGGTMNREAAVLGTPVYSVFNGKPSAVDKYLIGLDRMKMIATEDQVSEIYIEKKHRKEMLVNRGLANMVVDEILNNYMEEG